MQRAILPTLDLLTCGWVLWTLYPVARYGGAVLFDSSTTGRVMAVRTAHEIVSAIGLTYTGLRGAALVLGEIALVGAALVLSASRRAPLGRLCHALLIGWTLLWLGNSLWLQQLAGGHGGRTVLAAIALIVVLARTALRWNPVSVNETSPPGHRASPSSFAA